jgi:hypothetical protein
MSSGIPRSGSSPLFIYPFEINTPRREEDSDSDNYDLESLSDTSSIHTKTLQKPHIAPSSTLVPLMDKFRSLDKTIHHPNSQWIIRDIFLFLEKNDIEHLLATSKNIAYCTISDPLLKERFHFLFPRGINFDPQVKFYNIQKPREHLLGLRILNPNFRVSPSLLTKIVQILLTLCGLNKPDPTLSEPVSALDPEPQPLKEEAPQEIVWTISDLPLGARIAKKPRFLRPIVLPSRKSLDTPKLPEKTCTISKKPSRKRPKPAYIRPLTLPTQNTIADTATKTAVVHRAKIPRRGFYRMNISIQAPPRQHN